MRHIARFLVGSLFMFGLIGCLFLGIKMFEFVSLTHFFQYAITAVIITILAVAAYLIGDMFLKDI